MALAGFERLPGNGGRDAGRDERRAVVVSAPVSVDAGFGSALRRLADAQKSSKGGPAYSVWVNRRLGRYAAAAAYSLGLTPNLVTALSAACSAAAVALIVLTSGWWTGIGAALLLVLGYLLDSADGQLARLQGGGSLAGEWLDHMVDSVKITVVHLAVLVHLYRFDDLDTAWLLVPVGFTVVAVSLFFAQLLNEQLRRNKLIATRPQEVGVVEQASFASSMLKLPSDYGVLCWSFVLLGAPDLFLAVYTFLFVCNLAYWIVALRRWFAQIQALDAEA
jgi:phosphatidylglycerophosphate synthase